MDIEDLTASTKTSDLWAWKRGWNEQTSIPIWPSRSGSLIWYKLLNSEWFKNQWVWFILAHLYLDTLIWNELGDSITKVWAFLSIYAFSVAIFTYGIKFMLIKYPKRPFFLLVEVQIWVCIKYIFALLKELVKVLSDFCLSSFKIKSFLLVLQRWKQRVKWGRWNMLLIFRL